MWNKTTYEVMFYISSLPPIAQQLGKAIRQHWSIENQLHWVLDVTFGEDASRIRTGHAPENMAILRRWSINLLNQETSFKRSTRQKLKRASIDEAYMLKVLGASIALQSSLSGGLIFLRLPWRVKVSIQTMKNAQEKISSSL